MRAVRERIRMESGDKIKKIIVTNIVSRGRGNPASLTRAILEVLWEAGYEVTTRQSS
jgi:hypothetical protein